MPLSPRSRKLLACLLLALAILGAYSNTLHCEFVFDDTYDIVDSASIRRLWPIWKVFLPSVAGKTFLHGRPVVNLSLAVNYATGGLETFHYHLTNLAIHVLAALTLFGILGRTFSLPSLAPRYAPAAVPLAFVIAAAWALHPLQTQAVTYIIQRYESMMGLFYLLTLYSALRSDSSPHPHWWEAGAVAACLLALGCKEVAVSAPLVILLYDRAFLAGSFREAWRRRRGMYLGLAGAWAAFAVLLALSWDGRTNWAGFGLRTTPWEYARSQGGVILHYLRLSFWPSPQVFDYGWPVARTAGEIVPGAMAVGALLVATGLALVSRPKWGLLGAWFFLILAPTSSIMPIADLAFEHRMYLPLAAVATAAILAGHAMTTRWMSALRISARGQSVAQLAVVLVILTALGAATLVRNRVYASEASVWADTIQKAPGNPRGYTNLGWVLFASYGKVEEAIAHCRLALKIAPWYVNARCNLGAILQSQGKVDEAVACYRKVLEDAPRHPKAHYNLAVGLAQQGKGEEAVAHFLKTLEVTPEDADCHYNLARVLLSLGRKREALVHYETALSINPGDADCRCSLANVLLAEGRVAEAMAHYQEAVSARPTSAEFRQQLGRAFYLQGKGREALLQWREASRLQPNQIPLLNLLAWELATCPDPSLRQGDEAVQLAQRACQLAGERSAELLDTLAAAMAEQGRFADAVRTAQEAAALASGRGDQQLAAAIQSRIKLYQAGTPFRDPKSPIARPKG